jgi:hypothetical protein
MRNEQLVKWEAAALALEPPFERVRMPIYVLAGEAVDLVRFGDCYWHVTRDAAGQISRPGLELAARPGQFEKSILSEIMELQEALLAAQTEYLLTLKAGPEAPFARASFVLGELQLTLEFALGQGPDDDRERLEQFAEQYERPTSHDAMAAALDAYASFAEMHVSTITGLGGFDPALIGEARELARTLHEQSAGKVAGDVYSTPRAALDLRNRIAALLLLRMNVVRTVIRFVFRHQPELVRRSSSVYQRRARAEARRKRKAQKPDAA